MFYKEGNNFLQLTAGFFGRMKQFINTRELSES